MDHSAFSRISKVEIKKLWKRFDIEWNLNKDVNILSGINGSGKSTILDCIGKFITFGFLPDRYVSLIQSIRVTFDNGKSIFLEYVDENNQTRSFSNFADIQIYPKQLNQSLNIDIINTFDKEIQEAGRQLYVDIRTELDKDIFILQKYLDYQIKIGKRVIETVTKSNHRSQDEILEIKKRHERFLDIMDSLFENTDKKINKEKNEITFIHLQEEIASYQLSSGEKQILVILLTVLVRDDKPSIIFMDEPEISLHFDWQKKLIQYILELNPNLQVILATHSPAIIIEGWRNKVTDVEDIIVFDHAN